MENLSVVNPKSGVASSEEFMVRRPGNLSEGKPVSVPLVKETQPIRQERSQFKNKVTRFNLQSTNISGIAGSQCIYYQNDNLVHVWIRLEGTNIVFADDSFIKLPIKPFAQNNVFFLADSIFTLTEQGTETVVDLPTMRTTTGNLMFVDVGPLSTCIISGYYFTRN
ncbi:MAG: hypothetical protein ACRDBG_05660 [Waterburya sp.]